MTQQDSHAEGPARVVMMFGGALIAVSLGAFAIAVTEASNHPPPAKAAQLRPAQIVVQATPASQSVTRIGRNGPIPFERDACLEFPPTARPNGITVALDPGHGGVDPGAIAAFGGRTVSEKQATLAVGLRALSLLRGAGYRVVMSRVRDSTVARFGPHDVQHHSLTDDAAQREIEARNLCANAAHARALIAIHMNAFSDPSAVGTETVYCPSRPFAARSRRLADLVQRAMLRALSASNVTTLDRRVQPDRTAGGAALTPQTADYHHLIELGPADRPWLPYPSLMPGVLVEPVFLTNPAQASFVLSRRGQLALARALLDALDNYFAGSGVA